MFGALWRKIKHFCYVVYLQLRLYRYFKTPTMKRDGEALKVILNYEQSDVECKLASEWGERLRRVRRHVGDREYVLSKLPELTKSQLVTAENGIGSLTEIQRIYRLVSQLDR